MADRKVGDRVQTEEIVDGNSVFYVGTITEVHSSEKETERYDYVTRKYVPTTYTSVEGYKVKWDDGEEEVVKRYDVHDEDSEVEREFRLINLVAQKEIENKLKIASEALNEAESLADKYGVPFYSGISPLSQSYFPHTTREKFPDVDQDFINEVTGAYHTDYGGEGWQHSAVC